MKANLLLLTMLTIATTVSAREAMYVDDGRTAPAVATIDFKVPPAFAESDKDMKIANLNKLLDQQQRLYDEKISYLEDELKKSKERLIDKSINQEKLQTTMEKRFAEESTFLKKELVSKTKTLMEYQRQLEKIKPSEDMKNLIKINTDLAVELRKNADQMAIMQLKGPDVFANKDGATPATKGRMPASVGK